MLLMITIMNGILMSFAHVYVCLHCGQADYHHFIIPNIAYRPLLFTQHNHHHQHQHDYYNYDYYCVCVCIIIIILFHHLILL